MIKSPRTALASASVLFLTPGIAAAAVALAPAISTDVAQSKPTFGDVAFGAPTSRGNDGINGNDNNGNWTHANYPTSAVPYPGGSGNAPNPYWEVDLQGSFDLTSIALTD
ncbi:MAG: hypothetical protein P8J87_11905, partial [Verrucomicrobiales bacterium]|nr:hypothetical protein [Verrucomicrobiales bacterium]